MPAMSFYPPPELSDRLRDSSPIPNPPMCHQRLVHHRHGLVTLDLTYRQIIGNSIGTREK